METVRDKTRKSKSKRILPHATKRRNASYSKTGTIRYGRRPTRLRPERAFGIPQSEILAAARTGDGGGAKAYADALRRLGRYIVERALLGELQYSVAAEAARRARHRRKTAAGRERKAHRDRDGRTRKDGANDMEFLLKGYQIHVRRSFFCIQSPAHPLPAARRRRQELGDAAKIRPACASLRRPPTPAAPQNATGAGREPRAAAANGIIRVCELQPDATRIYVSERQPHQAGILRQRKGRLPVSGAGIRRDRQGRSHPVHRSQMQFITTCNRGVRRDFSPACTTRAIRRRVGHAWVKRFHRPPLPQQRKRRGLRLYSGAASRTIRT